MVICLLDESGILDVIDSLDTEVYNLLNLQSYFIVWLRGLTCSFPLRCNAVNLDMNTVGDNRQ